MEMIIENIRCFSGIHRVPIKPITVLIGENSTGKTTLLACLEAISDYRSYPYDIKLNNPSYSLGSFEDIITKNTSNHDGQFSIGFVTEIILLDEKSKTESEDKFEVNATFREKLGRPYLTQYSISTSFGSLIVNRRANTSKYSATLTDNFKNNEKTIIIDTKDLDNEDRNDIDFLIYQSLTSRKNHSFDKSDKLVNLFVALLMPKRLNSSTSIAPIRTEPKRTYHQFKESDQPSGGDIPLILADYLEKPKRSKKIKSFTKLLNEFGVDSGLFNKIHIERFKKGKSAPFQVVVDTNGIKSNLKDVGYGVSQSLPIIVKSIIANNKIVLIQQPGIHLHPKAQAALGTFFAKLVKQNKDCNYVIESHSDYLFDRLRLEVVKKNLSPSDVVFLYLERKSKFTKIYPLEIDENGNILNAPPSYRDFFLKEDLNLLRRTSK